MLKDDSGARLGFFSLTPAYLTYSFSDTLQQTEKENGICRLTVQLPGSFFPQDGTFWSLLQYLPRACVWFPFTVVLSLAPKQKHNTDRVCLGLESNSCSWQWRLQSCSQRLWFSLNLKLQSYKKIPLATEKRITIRYCCLGLTVFYTEFAMLTKSLKGAVQWGGNPTSALMML